MGTLSGMVAFLVLQRWLSRSAMGWLIVSLPVGWWACARAARDLGIADPGAVVWDGVVAFWIVLWLVTPAGLWLQCRRAVLRVFDAAKPGPVGWASAYKPAPGAAPGWPVPAPGILFDDLVAAFCALVMALFAFGEPMNDDDFDIPPWWRNWPDC